jgi:hypothetical protein
MSDSDDGLSDGGYPDSAFYDGSEGDQDEIARDLDEEDDGSVQDPEDAESSKLDDDDDDPPEVTPGPSVQQPNKKGEEVPGISGLVLILLRAAHPAWVAEKGSKRKKVWKDLLRELRDLPENGGLLESEWVLRGEVCDRQILSLPKTF